MKYVKVFYGVGEGSSLKNWFTIVVDKNDTLDYVQQIVLEKIKQKHSIDCKTEDYYLRRKNGKSIVPSPQKNKINAKDYNIFLAFRTNSSTLELMLYKVSHGNNNLSDSSDDENEYTHSKKRSISNNILVRDDPTLNPLLHKRHASYARLGDSAEFISQINSLSLLRALSIESNNNRPRRGVGIDGARLTLDGFDTKPESKVLIKKSSSESSMSSYVDPVEQLPSKNKQTKRFRKGLTWRQSSIAIKKSNNTKTITSNREKSTITKSGQKKYYFNNYYNCYCHY